MSEFLEAVMMVCFGISWPINAVKAYRAGTAESTSPLFLCLILVGYVAGITAKLVAGRINYVLAVYIINFCTVTINLVVYFINKRKDCALCPSEPEE